MDKKELISMGEKIRNELVYALLEGIQRKNVDISQETCAELPEKQEGEYDVKEELNVTYINLDEVPLAMDIFRPETGDDRELPVFVVVHGGGLVLGDRRLSRNFGRVLARKGYLVFSIEYRLIPRANVYEVLYDISAGLDFVAKKLDDYPVDRKRIYMTCESAGGFLSLYAAAGTRSETLQEKSGIKPRNFHFNGIGIISGMLYTALHDPLGAFMHQQYLSNEKLYALIKEYTDPTHPEIINNLPPVFLVTSRGDFLNNYTLMYHKALKEAGKPVKLKYYGSNDLEHAFVTLRPALPESQDAIDCMLNWFEEQNIELKKETASDE